MLKGGWRVRSELLKGGRRVRSELLKGGRWVRSELLKGGRRDSISNFGVVGGIRSAPLDDAALVETSTCVAKSSDRRAADRR